MPSSKGIHGARRFKGEHGNIAVAIDSDKNSQAAVKWALENLLTKKTLCCFFIHVQCNVSNPGNLNGESKTSRPPNAQELQQYFLPYRGICARKGVKANEIVIGGGDVATAITEYIANNSIDSVVVGASNRNLLSRKFWNPDVPSSLMKSAPETCAVYVIYKGKVQASRPSRPQTPTGGAVSPWPHQSSCSSTATPSNSQTHSSVSSRPRTATPAQSQRSGSSAATSRQHQESLPCVAPYSPNSQNTFRFSGEESERSIEYPPWTRPREDTRFSNRTSPTSGDYNPSDPLNQYSMSDGSHSSGQQSFPSSDISSDNMDYSYVSGSSKSSASSRCSNSPMTAREVDEELWRLKLELKQSMQVYHSVCKDAVTLKKMTSEVHPLKMSEARKLEEARLSGESALFSAGRDKHKTKFATEVGRRVPRLAEAEARRRETAESRAHHIARRRTEGIVQISATHRKYTIEEIEIATDYFASSNKIGEGGYGPVYKAVLHQVSVAIKILRPDISQGQKQFQQELEVLSNMRHPHMVVLLGSCPEYGCLVYEYMEQGSLEDRLFRKDNTPPIPWRIRFKIAFEIATGLLFLHQSKPEPLVHRDLKPANILLDGNYVSKIADVGLARLVPASVADSVTQYHLTAAAGTFCYIDPEYQQSGMLGVKSDLYSFGVVLLQLLTAKSPMGLSHHVEQAIENGTFADMLDPTVTNWPVEGALSLAKMALKCCELRKKDRPDLATVVLPELNRLRDLALLGTEAEEPATNSPPPNDSVPAPNDSVPELKTPQINVKRRWDRRLWSMVNLRSFKKNNPKDSSVLPPKPNGAAGKSKLMESCGCLSSLGNCAPGTNAPLVRFRSFS